LSQEPCKSSGAYLADGFHYENDGAGNLLSFSSWDETGVEVKTVNVVYSGAKQITCIERNDNGDYCDAKDILYT
jgi:hypothetical protein